MILSQKSATFRDHALGKVNPAGAGRPFEAGWMANHWGSRPRPSSNSRASADVAAHRRGDAPPPYPPPQVGEGREGVTRSGAPVARLAHTQEVGCSIRPSATIMGRYARGQSSGAVNAVPSGFGGSNPSPARHAAVAQR